MSEQGGEPRIDPQPGELGGGEVNVEGGTERIGTPSTGAAAGRGGTSGGGPGGVSGGAARDEPADQEDGD